MKFVVLGKYSSQGLAGFVKNPSDDRQEAAKKITEAGARVTVISSDKDLMQLVNNKIRLFDPMKSKVIGEKEVLEKFGVKPNQAVSYTHLTLPTILLV